MKFARKNKKEVLALDFKPRQVLIHNEIKTSAYVL